MYGVDMEVYDQNGIGLNEDKQRKISGAPFKMLCCKF